LNVYRRRPFLTLLDVKADPLTLVECFESIACYSAVMYKNISTFIILDKAKPLLFIKPLYFSFCQFFCPPFNIIPGCFPASAKDKKPPLFRKDLRTKNGFIFWQM
jgi:hypothetical protein